MAFLAAIPAALGLTTVQTIALGAGVAGAGVEAVSSIASGYRQSEAMKTQAEFEAYGMRARAAGAEAEAGGAEYNRLVMEQEAATTRQAGEYQAQQLREKQRRMAGTVAANVGASGVTPAGTPLEVMSENTRLMEQELLAQQYNVEIEARRYESKATLYGYEAAQERAAGGYYTGAAGYYSGLDTSRVAQGYLGAGQTLLGAGYKFFGPQSYVGKPGFGPSLADSLDYDYSGRGFTF